MKTFAIYSIFLGQRYPFEREFAQSTFPIFLFGLGVRVKRGARRSATLGKLL
jgi:hypothetical protein